MGTLVGRIRNDYNALVLALAIDRSAAGSWQGSDAADYLTMTDALIRGEQVDVVLAGVHGLLLELGGGGVADVYRVAGELVVVECIEDVDSTSVLDATGSGARELGTLEITSGALALLHSLDPGHSDGAHVFVDLPNGRYAVTGDVVRVPGPDLVELARVRIVRATTGT
jgi:hypothetical protein